MSLREMTDAERALVSLHLDEIAGLGAKMSSRFDRQERIALAYLAACGAAMHWRPDQGTPFPAYAMVCMRNLIRGQSRRQWDASSLTDEDSPRHWDRLAIDERDERSNRLARLNAVMDNLSERQRTVVSLRSQGVAFAAIAARLGISHQRVREIFAGAVAWLRDTLTRGAGGG
jgi:RNA polymerase sigma factor (sigma-70 family)